MIQYERHQNTLHQLPRSRVKDRMLVFHFYVNRKLKMKSTLIRSNYIFFVVVVYDECYGPRKV